MLHLPSSMRGRASCTIAFVSFLALLFVAFVTTPLFTSDESRNRLEISRKARYRKDGAHLRSASASPAALEEPTDPVEQVVVGGAGRYANNESSIGRTSSVAKIGTQRRPVALDFAVAAFPKTGTSFLLQVLGGHQEIRMPTREFCEIRAKDGDKHAKAWLQSSESNSSRSVRYGIKCPNMVREATAIDNLAKMSSHTRLVVGVRHPLRWFESFYNYRVQNHYEQRLNETIPSPHDLTERTVHWQGVSTFYAKFEIYLMQLAKVSIKMVKLIEMLAAERIWPKRISPNKFKVFIYEVGQLHDKNQARQRQFQLDLQEFLQLETPLIDFNKVVAVNSEKSSQYREHMDICDPRYADIRRRLLKQGRRTSQWINRKFIASSEVVVSNKEHFSSLLDSWGNDPCQSNPAVHAPVLPRDNNVRALALPRNNNAWISRDRAEMSQHGSLALDFAVIGFPKTGTTFLLKVLGSHAEIEMPSKEFCDINKDDGVAQMKNWLQSVQSNLNASPPLRYGIKCPVMVRTTHSITNLVKMSDRTRLIVGVRHPVRWFESFYNYRVREHYTLGKKGSIPDPHELTNGKRHWRDVSTFYARYEIYLMQLAKVALDAIELKRMVMEEILWSKELAPNPFKVFIYEDRQLDDTHVARRSRFQLDLQDFLGLKNPLDDFGKVPKKNVAGNLINHPEHMDICKPRYDELRKQLLQHGRTTSLWITTKFIESSEVIVSNKDNFVSIVNSWGDDPCQSS